MKHILEKKFVFYGVIVRTYWMTLVLNFGVNDNWDRPGISKLKQEK